MWGHRRVGRRPDRPRRGTPLRRALALAALLAPVFAAAAQAAPPPSLLGEPPLGRGVLRFPQALAYSPGAQHVVVGDQYSSVVQVFARDGTWERDIAFHADAREPGGIGVVGGLAVDRNGHLFVLDSGNDRIQAFALADGRWLGAFGSRGTGPGEFRLGDNTGAGGIALTQPDAATAPVVYIADQYNHRIQRFTLGRATPGGERVLPAGARDPGDGAVVPVPEPDLPPWGHRGDCCTPDGFSYPQGLAVDARLGHLLIADDRNHRIVVEDLDGAFLAQIGGFGTGPGQFRFPYDVGVDDRAPRQLYVADNNNHRIQAFDAASLAFVTAWGGFGPEPGRMEYLRALGALADDPSGGVGAADTANNRVQVFGPQGDLLAAWGIAGRGPGYVTRPRGVAVDATGAVAVADTLDARIERFDPDGTYAGQIGRVSPLSGFTAPGSAVGSLDGPSGVAFGVGGDVWIADTRNDRVVRVTPDGTWAEVVTDVSAPAAVAVGPDGSVLVADTGNDRIRRRDASGAWTTLELGTLDGPGAVAVAPDGTVYVADAARVLEIAPGGGAGGAPVPVPPPAGRTWHRPLGLAADARRLVVADATLGDGAVLARPRAGGAWETLAGHGTGPGEVVAPRGVALSPRDGAVLVADAGNNRIVRLGAAAPPAQVLTVTAGPLAGGTVTSDPAGIACPTDCGQRFGQGRSVTLAATPAPGWRFTGWTGACTGAGACAVRLDAPAAVGAAFAPVPGAPPPPPPPVLPPSPTSPSAAPPPRDLVAPRLGVLGLVPRTLRRGTRARLRFTLSEPATVTLRVQAARPGRRRGGACVAPGRAPRRARPCRRWVGVPGLRRVRAPAGRGSVVLTRRFAGRALRAGDHRLVLVARDSAGNREPARRVAFRVGR